MQCGFVFPSGDARTVAEWAAEAEAAGWDGVFYPDGIVFSDSGIPVHDPWVVLAAIAMRTERMRLGPMLTPLSRRRPWKIARETVTLDHLSRGRLILAVGLGAVDTFGPVGEVTDRKTRAEMLDESLAILTGLWSGGPFRYDGDHYQIEEVVFLPTPVQTPRIPIWVAGAWPRERSMARALRYDGLLPNPLNPDGTHGVVTPENIGAMAAYIRDHRPPPDPFDIIVEGRTPGDDPAAAMAIVQPFAEAGATWWLDAMWEAPNGPEEIRRRLQQGPPQVV